MKQIKAFLAAVCLVIAYAVNQVVERYIAVQLSPSIQFSDGPEQVFGLDMIHGIGFAVSGVFVIVAIWLLYSAFVKKANKGGTTNEEELSR